jgi:hypothetical protein
MNESKKIKKVMEATGLLKTNINENSQAQAVSSAYLRELNSLIQLLNHYKSQPVSATDYNQMISLSRNLKHFSDTFSTLYDQIHSGR